MYVHIYLDSMKDQSDIILLIVWLVADSMYGT